MSTETPMYQWRHLSSEQRAAVLAERQRHPRPWHGPPHVVDDSGLYLITAACYEHRPIIGISPQRMAEFETELLKTTDEHSEQIFAWVVLPNHYHLLVEMTEPTLSRGMKKIGGDYARWFNKRHRRVGHRVGVAPQ